MADNEIEFEEGGIPTIEETMMDIIDNQLGVIASMGEIDASLYDEAQEDKIKVVSRAFNIIYRAQARLLKQIRQPTDGA